uniref:Uncharacterized protein n=1 Tax=Cacopsylla melanoneura TaxID=428564 RepID=A0A8D8W1D7_9HEMI
MNLHDLESICQFPHQRQFYYHDFCTHHLYQFHCYLFPVFSRSLDSPNRLERSGTNPPTRVRQQHYDELETEPDSKVGLLFQSSYRSIELPNLSYYLAAGLNYKVWK